MSDGARGGGGMNNSLQPWGTESAFIHKSVLIRNRALTERITIIELWHLNLAIFRESMAFIK